jgi:hypothetical protein
MHAKAVSTVILILCFAAIPARADSTYQVAGSMQVLANSSFPGVGETIDYSFLLDYSSQTGYTTVVGIPTITSFGPLGAFTMQTGTLNPNTAYIPFNSSSAEIDLGGFFSASFSPSPVVRGADLYSCSTQVACTEFWPDSLGGSAVGSQVSSGIGLFAPGTATDSVRLVPEPGTLCLFGFGALLFGLKKKFLN